MEATRHTTEFMIHSPGVARRKTDSL